MFFDKNIKKEETIDDFITNLHEEQSKFISFLKVSDDNFNSLEKCVDLNNQRTFKQGMREFKRNFTEYKDQFYRSTISISKYITKLEQRKNHHLDYLCDLVDEQEINKVADEIKEMDHDLGSCYDMKLKLTEEYFYVDYLLSSMNLIMYDFEFKIDLNNQIHLFYNILNKARSCLLSLNYLIESCCTLERENENKLIKTLDTSGIDPKFQIGLSTETLNSMESLSNNNLLGDPNISEESNTSKDSSYFQPLKPLFCQVFSYGE